ncbi:MAG TPA: hypothetical protein VIM70_18490 [Clostridium sp.]
MKFIIIVIILAITYVLLGGLMKAASKSAPSIPTIGPKDKDN